MKGIQLSELKPFVFYEMRLGWEVEIKGNEGD